MATAKSASRVKIARAVKLALNIDGTEVTFASVDDAFDTYIDASRRIKGVVKGTLYYSVIGQLPHPNGVFMTSKDASAKTARSACNRIVVATGGTSELVRRSIAEASLSWKAMSHGTFLGIMRDALAGKFKATSEDVFEGGNSPVLKKGIKPLTLEAVQKAYAMHFPPKVEGGKDADKGGDKGKGGGDVDVPESAKTVKSKLAVVTNTFLALINQAEFGKGKDGKGKPMPDGERQALMQGLNDIIDAVTN